MGHLIESSQNTTFKKLKSLLKSKGIKKEMLFLAQGKHVLDEVEKSGLWFQSIHYDEGYSPDYLLSRDLFEQLSILNTKDPIYLLKTIELPNADLNVPPDGPEVILPVGDPKNLGALIRTCLAFSVKKIILTEESANPYLPDCIKSSSGAVLKAPLERGPSVNELSPEFVHCLDKAGDPLQKSSLKGQSFRLLLGEEGGRIPKAFYKRSLSIPISDHVESLNVNSCLSIALYELTRIIK